jgi:hypothetical protein
VVNASPSQLGSTTSWPAALRTGASFAGNCVSMRNFTERRVAPRDDDQKLRPKLNCGQEIVALKVRVILDDLIDGHTRSQELQ